MSNENINITEVEDKVCDFFEISREDLYSRSLKQRHTNPRHYLWFILHCHYGMSNTAIARRYGKARVTVIQYITEIKFRILNQRDDKSLYEDIKKILNEH